MKRRTFCGMSLLAGTAASLPIGRLLSAPNGSSQPASPDLRAVKLSGAETTLERAAVQDLRATLVALHVNLDKMAELRRETFTG